MVQSQSRTGIRKEYPSVPHRPPQLNTSVPHKSPQFNAKIPQFHTKNPSVLPSPQFQSKPSSFQYHKSPRSTPSVPHQKPLTSTLPSVSHRNPLNSTPISFWCGTEGFSVSIWEGWNWGVFGVNRRGVWNWGVFGVEPRGFWCGTERFLVWKWGIWGLKRSGPFVCNWCVEVRGGVELEGTHQKIFKLWFIEFVRKIWKEPLSRLKR